MEKEKQYLYTIEDLNKAFDMGLETAVFVIERSIGLSQIGQRYLLECMEDKIMESKIASANATRSINPGS